MATIKADKPRGILYPAADKGKFEHTRYLPAPDVGYFVEHFWIVSWDLRGEESRAGETLPHPSVHLVIEKDKSRIVGVVRGKFSRILENKGRVLGVKFKPGAFYAFTKSPVSKLTDSTIALHDVFGVDGDLLEKSVLLQEEVGKMIELVESFLRERLPERDETIEVIDQIVACIIAESEITKVEDLVSRFDLNKRTLQRIFSRYVGVSPKWMIQRYRLHEAVEQLAGGQVLDWPKMALDLGYFDQAHFIKDFKTIVGVSPTEYAKINARLSRSQS